LKRLRKPRSRPSAAKKPKGRTTAPASSRLRGVKSSILPGSRPLNNSDVVRLHARATDWEDSFFRRWRGERFYVDVKRDGERALVYKTGDQVLIANKYKSVYLPSDSKFKPRDFPSGTNIVAMPEGLAGKIMAALGKHDGIFDAEYRSKNDDLYSFLSERTKPSSTETMVTLFDILEIDGQDVRSEPLSLRKDILEDSVKSNDRVEVVETHIADNEKEARELAKKYIKRGFEGAVVKPAGKSYDTSESWLKIKTKKTADVVILGVEKTKDWTARKIPHSFLVGVYDKKRKGWYVVGEVGTGLDENVRGAIGRQIGKIAIPDQEARGIYGDAYNPKFIYTDPAIVLEVAYSKITAQGHLREPRILHTRGNKAPEECSFSQIFPPERLR